ncbi:MAG: hypothetical protein DCC71_21320 [Proteobacteria bacterium]|nr:MAG: hypothetical protein DCC71_21320 [Pseudomonadota bacterium]
MRSAVAALVAIFALAGADAAHALSFGTLASAVAVPGAGAPLASFEAHPDASAAASAASESEGAAAHAVADFAASGAAVAAAPGASAYAASLWTDTFTITHPSGAAGTARVAFDLVLSGTLDPGAAPGGFARASFRAVAGLAGEDSLFEDGFAALGVSAVFERACADVCDAPLTHASTPIRVETEFSWGVPFRFDALLELTAAGGASADFTQGAWLAAITLPEGAALHAASTHAYAALLHTPVPEPSTALLLLLGLAPFARTPRRRAHGSARSRARPPAKPRRPRPPQR